MNTASDEDRSKDVIIWTIGWLNKLANEGLVCRPTTFDELTDEGMKHYQRLVREGFEPTIDEMKEAVDLLQSRK